MDEPQRERLLAARDQAQALAARSRAFQHGLELARIQSEEAKARRGREAARADAVLEADECKTLWSEIVALQKALAETPRSAAGSIDPSGLRSEPTYRTLLQAKVQRYEAEYQALLEESHVRAESEEETVAALREEVRENQEDLDKGLRLLDHQQHELAQAIATEREREDQHKLIRQALEDKLRQAQMDAEQQRAGLEHTSVHADLQGKIKTVGLENRRLMSKMAGFMSRYFPTPPADANAAPTKRGKEEDGGDKSKTKTAPLSAILEDLMNACMSRPHDPYISLTEKHWPPYVELLLRSGIAMSHPKQSDRIKLVEFHA